MEKSDEFGTIAGREEVIKGVYEVHHWDWTEITKRFVRIVYDLKLVLNFDWGRWSDGKAMLQNKDQDYSTLDTLTLCKLLTLIIRQDRFYDGYLISNLNNGTVLKILKALKNNYMDTKEQNQITHSGKLTEKQEQFIWLAYGEGKSYAEIAKLLELDRKEITNWENDKKATDFNNLKRKVSTMRKTFISKGFKCEFSLYKNRMDEMEKDKKCTYCGITESDLNQLWEIERKKGKKLTKRPRGKKLEYDRMNPDLKYDDLKNIVWACYWCNNAKTDTFTHEEFLEVGKTIAEIWKKRLGK
jgi:hypothetical protein